MRHGSGSRLRHCMTVEEAGGDIRNSRALYSAICPRRYRDRVAPCLSEAEAPSLWGSSTLSRWCPIRDRVSIPEWTSIEGEPENNLLRYFDSAAKTEVTDQGNANVARYRAASVGSHAPSSPRRRDTSLGQIRELRAHAGRAGKRRCCSTQNRINVTMVRVVPLPDPPHLGTQRSTQ